MRAVAIKKTSREKTTGFKEMGTLRCDGCGEEFFIRHDPAAADKRAAEKQAKWLEKVLAEEHERDRKPPTESNFLTSSHSSGEERFAPCMIAYNSSIIRANRFWLLTSRTKDVEKIARAAPDYITAQPLGSVVVSMARTRLQQG